MAISLIAHAFEKTFHLGWSTKLTIPGMEKEKGQRAVPSLSSSSLTFFRLNAGFLRDSGYTQSAPALEHRVQTGLTRSPSRLQ